MHICFNALDYPSRLGGGGVGNQVRLLARALVDAGHRVTVIALTQRGLPDCEDDGGIRVYRVKCGNWHWYLSRVPLLGRLLTLPVREFERSLTTYRQMRVLHQIEHFDLIEGTETGMFGVARWMFDVPYAIRLHGEPYTFIKYTPGAKLTLGFRLCRVLQGYALRRARLLISPSRAHAYEIAEELGCNRPPIEVVANALSREMGEAKSEIGNPKSEIRIPEGPIILYVGRLERGKGVPILLRAAARVLEEVPTAHLVLAGAEHPSLPRFELDALLRQLPGKANAHVLGHVPWHDLFAWYEKATVCVLPSHYETFGLAALEAMVFGVPVVASMAGGLPEIVEDEVTGLLVPPGDADALARAVTRILLDPSLRRRLGEQGLHRAREFRVTTQLSSNLALYDRVVGLRQRQPGAVGEWPSRQKCTSAI
jgi:glycosyltransferase involved in cell wall biosynthesis